MPAKSGSSSPERTGVLALRSRASARRCSFSFLRSALAFSRALLFEGGFAISKGLSCPPIIPETHNVVPIRDALYNNTEDHRQQKRGRKFSSGKNSGRL